MMRREQYRLISVFLGIIGAGGLLFLGCYIILVFQTYSEITLIGKLAIQIFALSTLMIASALISIYGSLTMLKNGWKGGIINILAGTIIPIPTHTYFAFFSEPKLLTSWLIPIGIFILLLPIISGGMSLLLLKADE